MIIFVDGIDRVGKDTLISELHAYTDHKYHLFNRSVLSSVVYGEMYKRRHYKDLNYNSKESIIVLLVPADFKVIEQRIAETNHEMFDIKQHHRFFMEAASLFNNVIYIKNDTPIEDIVSILDKEISERTKKHSIVHDVFKNQEVFRDINKKGE